MAAAKVRSSASGAVDDSGSTCTKRTAHWRIAASSTAARATASADPSFTRPATTSRIGERRW